MALTFLGWTPGLRQIVSGRVLACGCLVGVYEMWNGGFVEILDGPCDSCGDSYHEVNRVLRLASSADAADIQLAPVTAPRSNSDDAVPHPTLLPARFTIHEDLQ